mmetsp:Transcript_57786/g.125459  ORF Transcript_57786/g.125459 Transcript_57786/m.125459 type:complete len:304 (+) Transcript_57786:429-1340(+)
MRARIACNACLACVALRAACVRHARSRTSKVDNNPGTIRVTSESLACHGACRVRATCVSCADRARIAYAHPAPRVRGVCAAMAAYRSLDVIMRLNSARSSVAEPFPAKISSTSMSRSYSVRSSSRSCAFSIPCSAVPPSARNASSTSSSVPSLSPFTVLAYHLKNSRRSTRPLESPAFPSAPPIISAICSSVGACPSVLSARASSSLSMNPVLSVSISKKADFARCRSSSESEFKAIVMASCSFRAFGVPSSMPFPARPGMPGLDSPTPALSCWEPGIGLVCGMLSVAKKIRTKSFERRLSLV